MKYGRLFTRYSQEYQHQPTATRCSALERKELMQMAKNLRSHDAAQITLRKYPQMKTEDLVRNVYTALQQTYND